MSNEKVFPTSITMKSISLITFILFLCCVSGCKVHRSSVSELGDDIIGPESLLQPGEVSGALKQYSDINQSTIPYNSYSEYMAIEPGADFRCDLPQDAGFIDISDKLGGFKRPLQIPVERDATVPRLFSGYENHYINTFAEDTDSGQPSVSIQRADKVGSSGNIAFYLSDYYGLILVDINTSPGDTTARCAYSLPGIPKNFLIRNNTLLVMTNSLNGYGSAIIQFSITPAGLAYMSSQYIEKQNIIDVRLFNDTLAVLTSEPVVNTAENVAEGLYSYYGSLYNHRLHVFSTQPSLQLLYTEIFMARVYDEWSADTVKVSSYFNQFLSASGQYLVAAESVTTQTLTGHETRSYSYCTAYNEIQTQYCTTKWKTIANPDYTPPPSGGVYSCGGTLYSCLRSIGPKVSKYINVPDGQTCSSYTQYVCSAYETRTYDVPVYSYVYTTRFHVYRFQDGQFTKLDDKLGRVSGGDILPTEEPFSADGFIAKHDHIYFNDDVLYAVTSKYDTTYFKSINLKTFTLQGNSPIYISSTDLGYLDYADEINCAYTDSTIYVSKSAYRSGKSTTLATLNIADPVAPGTSNWVTIPTHLDQLFFSSNALIGIGETSLNLNNEWYKFGTATLFSGQGAEINSLVLGTDYKSYYSATAYDDQAAVLDSTRGRLLLPYSCYDPFDTSRPHSRQRLTMMNFTSATIEEEQTFSLQRQPDRALSISDDLALAFSNYNISALYRDGSWKSKDIFDGSLPVSIYQSRSYPLIVKKYITDSSYIFELSSQASLSRKDVIGTLTVERFYSPAPYLESNVYFDQDRILIARGSLEYFNYYFITEELYNNQADSTILAGYRITETGFEEIYSTDELSELYRAIKLKYICVIDTANYDGHEIYSFTEIPGTSTCMTSAAFYSMSGK
jgi:hypothetical protein